MVLELSSEPGQPFPPIAGEAVELAQAGGSGAETIGQVSLVKGSVFITQVDGTKVTAADGTPIFQGDVIETGGDGAIGITFADQSTFSLAEQGSMVIDEMVYDASSQSGKSSISVAEGVFTFVSGQIAKTDVGAMTISTPVATIGIRGTSGGGQAAAEGTPNTFTMFADPGGGTGEMTITTQGGAIDTMVLPTSSGLGFTDPTASLADQVEDVDPIEPVFVIDPAADFVKEGIAAYESKRYDQAAAYFAAEAEARSGSAWTHYILALSQWKSGSAGDAADSMRRSIDIDATQVKALVNLSRIENDRGEFDAALTAADEALVLEPENAEASFLRARSLYNIGDKETALAALETSLDHDPENGYAHNLVGLIWIERGEGGLAADAMEQAAQRIPDVTFVQNNLGMSLELSGRLDEAAVAYARAVELSPDHERAAMNLARLDGRIPEFPADTVDEEPVVAVLTETDSLTADTAVETATDESEIPD